MNDLNDMVDVEGGNCSWDNNGSKVDENKGNQNKDGTEENTFEEEVLTCEEDEMVNNNKKESMDKGEHQQWKHLCKNGDKRYALRAERQFKRRDIVNNKLDFIPIEINEDGSEIMIFDEDLVDKGSVQWKLNVCGNFVGFRMSVHELRYHIRRMRSKWGVDDIDMKNDGTCMFKFRNEAGMNKVLELGPWIVSIVNVPLEAWSKEGISALASSLGDTMTAKRYSLGEGRMDFARILVEFDVMKGFKEKIELQYRDKDNNKKGTKHVKVEYAWKPDICSHCKVFGHSFLDCVKRERSVDELEEDARKKEEVIRKKNKENKERIYNNNYMGNRRFRDRKQQKDMINFNDGRKINDEIRNKRDIWKRKKVNEGKQNNFRGEEQEKKGNDKDERDGVRSRNKFEVLNGMDTDNEELEILKGRMILKDMEDGNEDIEDVLEANSGIAKDLSTEEVEGVEWRSLWEDLRREKLITNGCPWILMGDFNVTLNMDEHSTRGSKSPSKPETSIVKKLDMVMINVDFISKYGDAFIRFLPFFISDHSPVILHLPSTLDKKKKAFKFSNFVADKEEFIDVVKNEWKYDAEGFNMFKLEYNVAVKDEEKLLAQKAKVKWLSEGEKNTKYFHNIIKSRMHSNRIIGVCDSQGNWFEGDNVAIQFVKHFEDFLGNNNDEEIKEVVFGFGNDKAPGPDGFTTVFLKKSWDIMRRDVCAAGCLDKLVSMNQSAFVPGRLVQDNLLITQELLKEYNRKIGPQRCALKIDIAKAYDTVNWDF
ncbi:RNA-directed DNA polymerase, eukaryota, reverse transcriptase zinc-binding domain protein [Tanacetum coccineum]